MHLLSMFDEAGQGLPIVIESGKLTPFAQIEETEYLLCII